MPGRLALKQLEQLIRKGEVDTVLTVFPDTFGRLMGKRVVGSYFLDHVADEGAHACIYLFTVDMEMEPLPGFKLTSWERGYGDMKVVPDLGTLRLLPWLAKTALVFCDVYTEEGEPIEEAPRWVLKRQVERAAAQGFVVKTAAELELYCFTESFEGARAKRYHNLTPVASYLEDYHILQTTKEEPLIRAIRNGMEGADVPVETSKGEWGRGQEEINLRYADAHRRGVGQPHVRLPALRRGPGPPRRESDPRRGREPLPRVRRDDRRGPPRPREPAQGAQALRGQRVRGRDAPPGAQDAARGDHRARALEDRARS